MRMYIDPAPGLLRQREPV